MRNILRILALIVIVIATAFWAVAGGNRGFTKTSVQKKTVDEITGIEAITYEDRFVPGVDFLGGALLLAGLFVGISFFLKKQPAAPSAT